MVKKDEIKKLKECIKEKDERLKTIEERWDLIGGIGLTIWYGFWIFNSYWLVLEGWVQIAANGKYGLVEYFNAHTISSINDYGYVPHVLDDGPGFILVIFLVIILALLSFGWFLLIILREDDE